MHQNPYEISVRHKRKCAAAHLRYLGTDQNLSVAVNDGLGLEMD